MINDIIKIKYSQEGYLPNYPPHLISNEEMCLAFINKNTITYPDSQYWFFYDEYPLLNHESIYLEDSSRFNSQKEIDAFNQAYENLITAFRYYFCRYTSKIDAWRVDIPNWIYSFMLGAVVNDSSDQEDRHYLLTGLNRDNIEDVMTKESEIACFRLSQRWVNRLDESIKTTSISKSLTNYSESDKMTIEKELRSWLGEDYPDVIVTRPPTMFGEQAIIKIIRLAEAV